MTHDWDIHECVHFECGCLEHVLHVCLAGSGGVWADRASKMDLMLSVFSRYWSAVFLVHYSCELPHCEIAPAWRPS